GLNGSRGSASCHRGSVRLNSMAVTPRSPSCLADARHVDLRGALAPQRAVVVSIEVSHAAPAPSPDAMPTTPHPDRGAPAAYPHLSEPIEVAPITIKNRIVRSAHGTLLTGERLIGYHEARAAGGVGMSTLEATGVHRNAPSVLPLYSDDVIPMYRELM